ncbi:MAG: DUF4386 family protein [Eubacteriales bacterium]
MSSILANKENFKNVDWAPLYKWTYFMSIIMLFIIPLQILIYFISPPPTTIEGFYQLFHTNWLLGLLSLDLLYIINNTILIFIYLALFLVLIDEKPAISLTGLIIGIIGITCYYSSNVSFEMLTLSQHFFNAQPIDQIKYLAAGEALMAGYTGTSFNVYYILNAITLLMYSLAMLKSSCFKKSIGCWGIASGVLMVVPSSAGIVGMIFSLLSLIPWVVFVFMITKYFSKKSKVNI